VWISTLGKFALRLLGVPQTVAAGTLVITTVFANMLGK